MFNPILLSDSYKYSHFNQYPEGTEKVHSYMESRGGQFDEIIFYGLNYYIENYLRDFGTELRSHHISAAKAYADKHGIPFNFEGWRQLDQYLNESGGELPIEINAVEEGLCYPTGTALFTMENTDPRFYWFTNWLETLLMKVWYPCTVATKAFHIKKMLLNYNSKTSDNPDTVNWQYHNFGDRGSSSVETALIGGLAHLTQFNGTDNFNAACVKLDKGGIAGSIPASEHSTVTSWGQENEFKFIRNYLELYKGHYMIACVLDSYNIYDAVDYVTGPLKQLIESPDYPIFVIRPDSGNPVQVLTKILARMDLNRVAYTVNSKGYKVWTKYRIIWGDGINRVAIEQLLDCMMQHGFSTECIAFGSGGDLMQKLDRDTCKFAIKCSAVQIEGKWRDVYKKPVDAPDKASKKGRLITVLENNTGAIKTIRQEDFVGTDYTNLMKKVY